MYLATLNCFLFDRVLFGTFRYQCSLYLCSCTDCIVVCEFLHRMKRKKCELSNPKHVYQSYPYCSNVSVSNADQVGAVEVRTKNNPG